MEDTESERASAINIVFIAFIVLGILFAAFNGSMKEVTDASFESAKSAVTLSLNLIGIMALWLGLVRVLEAGGLMYSLARVLRPLMVRLFPDVPSEHPAMGAMILNISANMLGLGNAATPFGVKAMVELNRLNPFKGTATNAMCLFLAINTSSVALFPLGVIGVRAAANASRPADIWIPTTIATLISTIIGISIAHLLARRDTNYLQAVTDHQSKQKPLSSDEESENVEEELPDYSHLLYSASPVSSALATLSGLVFFLAILYGAFRAPSFFSFFDADFASYWLMPALMLGIVAYGFGRGVKVYEAVTEGAKQGFEVAIRIIPFLVAILTAIGMFRASGAMTLLSKWITPVTELISMPAEVLPMALVRPLSGSGAFGVMSELVDKAPDSYSSFLASTMMGSTETTFYVLAVYFGAVGIVKIRHALIAALAADITGMIAACLTSAYFWTPAS